MPLLWSKYSRIAYSFAVSGISLLSRIAVFLFVSKSKGPADNVLSTRPIPLRRIITRMRAESSSRLKGFVK